jgi:hypothetical protein
MVGFTAVTGIAAVLAGLFAAQLYRELSQRSATAMARFHLQPSKTVREFKLFVAGNTLLCAGFGLFTYATYTSSNGLLRASKGILIAGTLFPVYVLYRWWRRL